MENNIAFPIAGSMAGAGIYSTIGGVGIVSGFGGIGIGLVGMTTAGTVIGSAVYGAVEGIGNGDNTAFVAMGLGAISGAGIYSTIGGVGVGFGGSAFGIGIGSMTAAGGIFGLGIYGLAKMFANSGTAEPIVETFNRMEDKISYMEAYNQAMMELNPLFADLIWEQQFSELEIEDELEMLKAQIGANTCNSFEFQSENIENADFRSELNSAEIELPEKFSWQLVKTTLGHTDTINSFAIKNNILVSASDDNTISLWNIETGKQIYSFFNSQEVQAVAINERIIAGAGFDKTITSWQLNNKNLDRIFSDRKQHSYSHENVIYALIFSNKGDLLISGSADRTIKVWNSITGSLKFTLRGHTGSVRTLAISPCDRFLISGSADGTIRIWDLATSLTKPHIIDEHSHEVTAITITPDSKYFISAAKDNYLKIWCMKSKKNIYAFKNNVNNINSVAVSPDSKIIAVGNIDGIVQVWDLATKDLLQSIKACSPIIFSNNGKYLITGNINNRIQILQKIVGQNQLNIFNYDNRKWWEILNISKNSSSIDIKVAYYTLVKQYHPDINPTEQAKEMMSIINRAYEESKKS